MGRGKSEATKKKMLEADLEKVRFMLFNNQKDKSFRNFSGRIENGVEETEQNQTEKIEEFSQEDIIRNILKKQDTFTVLPTGGGKSYCFQGPAICFSGITLVITPLVALIQDQVKNFNDTYRKLYERYVNGEEDIAKSKYYDGSLYRAIYPGMNGLSLKGMFDEIAEPYKDDENTEKKIKYKLLYVSPERLSNSKFIREFKRREEKGEIQIDCVVVDEAHCMSQWGFDFRESYLTVGKFISQLKKRPVIAAFSATVTRQDRQQISALLKFSKEAQHFLCYEKRNNLTLHTINCDNNYKRSETDEPRKKRTKIYELVKLLEKNRGKLCVIYCTTVKTVDILYTVFTRGKLKKHKFLPARYHGQMSDSQKRKNLRRFLYQESVNVKEINKNKVKKKPPTNIMIATKAFGMGIDCDNIEVIIHFDVPRSLEDYYQEIGRAGRSKDIKANCYLLYNQAGIKRDISRMMNDAGSEDFYKKVIAGDFSEDMRRMIKFYMFYRMARMWEYCLESSDNWQQKEDVRDGQEYIFNYFAEENIGEAAKQLLKKFVESTQNNNPEEHTDEAENTKEPFYFDEKFYESINNTKQKELIKELTQIVERVNELHINNTMLANYFRWHGDKYEIKDGEAKSTITIKEWKRNAKNITETRNSLFRTDIQEDTAFIRMVVPTTKLEDYVIPKWKEYIKSDSENDYIKVIFVVNQLNNKVERILRRSDTTWADIMEDDELRYLKNKDVSGLFLKELYLEWYENKCTFVQIKGKRVREVSFTLRVVPEKGKTEEEYKLNYFDLCVADAIYSIEVNGNKNIYIKTIWDVLSGYTKNSFSRTTITDENEGKTVTGIKKKIVDSINKMRRLYISIEDGANTESIQDEVFLPIVENKNRGYSYQNIPPLYRYAENINGEIIKVPVGLMKASNISQSTNKNTENNMSDSELTYSKSIENTVLMHYLLHRLAISRGRGRGNFVQFDTIYKIVAPYMHSRKKKDMKKFKEKIMDIMKFYKRIDYVSFGGYIKNFHFKFERGSDEIEYESIAIFQFKKRFKLNIEWGNDGAKVYEYKLSAETKNKIKKNADNYDEYDGIIFFRDEKLIKHLYDVMDKQLDENLDPEWIEEYNATERERVIIPVYN